MLLQRLTWRPAANSVRGMRRAVLLAFVLSTALASGGDSAAAPSAPAPGPAGWSLVFSDEFDAAGALDPAKWGYELGYIRNNEKQYYTSRSENARIEGGNLVIEGRKEAYQAYGYTSASINTRGRFGFLYRRVEVRAKLRPVWAPGRPSGCSARTSIRSGGRPAARSTSWRTWASIRSGSTQACTRRQTSMGVVYRALDTRLGRPVALIDPEGDHPVRIPASPLLNCSI
jgi:hypothetical protein